MGVDTESRLCGPPREVPWGVRAQLIARRGTVLGALVFGIGGGLAVLLLAASDPVGLWRLRQGVSDAPGRLVAVDDLNFSENHRRVMRYRYTYATPDDADRDGVCYGWTGLVPPPPPGALRDPKLRPGVSVEYSTRHPETSRIKIKGMRPGAASPVFGLVAGVVAVVGMAILLVGVRDGSRRARLLAVGELTRATVVSCRLADQQSPNPDGAGRSIAEVRQSWLAGKGAGPFGGLAPDNPTVPAMQSLAVWFMRFWTCGAVVLFGFGTVFLIVLVSLEPLRQRGLLPFKMQPTPRGTVLFLWGILAAWLLIGSFLVRSGFRNLALLSGKKSPGRLQPNPRLRCEFEFTPPGGEAARAWDTATFSERLGDEPTEPVLYDPERPARAILLDGLQPAVEVSEFGEWVGTEGLRAWLRLAVVVALVVGGPALGWVAWRSL